VGVCACVFCMVVCLSVAGDVDVVLLSHPDLEHMGALPYAIAKVRLPAV
jgi:Cft2 family RNA processing exonuclease